MRVFVYVISYALKYMHRKYQIGIINENLIVGILCAPPLSKQRMYVQPVCTQREQVVQYHQLPMYDVEVI
jgi:hypothetical protein